MSNRAQRRAATKARQMVRPQPGVDATIPLLSVFAERGAVTIHAGMGETFVTQLVLSVSDAKHFRTELDDVIRALETGLEVAKGPGADTTTKSGLILPPKGD